MCIVSEFKMFKTETEVAFEQNDFFLKKEKLLEKSKADIEHTSGDVY